MSGPFENPERLYVPSGAIARALGTSETTERTTRAFVEAKTIAARRFMSAKWFELAGCVDWIQWLKGRELTVAEHLSLRREAKTADQIKAEYQV